MSGQTSWIISASILLAIYIVGANSTCTKVNRTILSDKYDFFHTDDKEDNLVCDDITNFNSEIVAENPESIYILYIECSETNQDVNDIGDLKAFTNLRYFTIYKCNIQKLVKNSFKWFPHLVELNLYNSNIHQIDADAFCDLNSLNELFLYNNTLTNISKDAFRGLSNLTDINIVGNPLNLVASGEPTNEGELSIDAFSYMPNLKSLNLRQNKINVIRSNFSDNLNITTYLSINFNGVTEIEDFAFKNLNSLKDTLYLNGNELTVLNEHTFEGLINLEFVILSNNKIEEIHPKAFFPLVKLERILFEQNNLKTLPAQLFFNNPIIEDVYLGHNQIESIPSGLFANNPKIETLQFVNNKLTTIDVELFRNTQNYATIDLRFNKISVFPDFKILESRFVRTEHQFIEKTYDEIEAMV